MVISEFVFWVVAIALAAAFLLGVAQKWGWIEWAQVHAPTEFLHKLFSCKFCCSFWTCLVLSWVLCCITWQWPFLIVPACSTVIARELW